MYVYHRRMVGHCFCLMVCIVNGVLMAAGLVVVYGVVVVLMMMMMIMVLMIVVKVMRLSEVVQTVVVGISCSAGYFGNCCCSGVGVGGMKMLR